MHSTIQRRAAGKNSLGAGKNERNKDVSGLGFLD